MGVNATAVYPFVFTPMSKLSFNGHPPLGVNATYWDEMVDKLKFYVEVSTGTHPWG